MLLTLKPPALHNPTIPGASLASFHDYPSSQPSAPAPLYTPAATPASSSSPPQIHSVSNSHAPLPVSSSPQVGMSNNRPSINLPPPPGLPPSSAPQPPQSHPSSQPLAHNLGPIPNPPAQWEQSNDGMRNWLAAKAEEDKRRQEEEKSKQEVSRLEQRRLERDMLHESLERGIPPPMVPIIFASMGGTNMSVDVAVQWSQHYMDWQRAQQEAQFREIERAAPQPLIPNPYAQHPLPAPPQPPQSQARMPQAQAGPLTPYSNPLARPRADTGPSNAGPAIRNDQRLERLNTNEMTPIQPPRPPPGALGPPPTNQAPQGAEQAPQLSTPSQQQPQSSQQQQNSPTIFFYHWQPPSTQANQPTTPQEFTRSPKRQKLTGASASGTPAAQRSPQLQPASTESTPARRSGAPLHHHSRNQSDASIKGGFLGPQDQPAAGRQPGDNAPIQQRESPEGRAQSAASNSANQTPKLAEAVPVTEARRKSDVTASADLGAAASSLPNAEGATKLERESSRHTPVRKRESSRD